MTNVERTISVRGRRVPSFMYGTAWKEERTESLTRQAIDAGFRAIDTANQRRHYFEAGVGAAVSTAISDGVLAREDLFLQTKFTYVAGQDHRLPYDPNASSGEQVSQSLESSLEHLGTSYVDSYVLHGPSNRHGITPADRDVWRAMESAHENGRALLLGVSNVSSGQLAQIFELAQVKPAFVQNRCFARAGWDREVRAFCREHDIVYQGFSLLTANDRELHSPAFRRIVERTGKTPAQLVFRFALEVGMLPLTGTSSAAHLAEDLGAYDFELSNEDVSAIERISG